MLLLRGVAFGLFGLVFGSFLTVVVTRLPARVSVVGGRSMCPGCGSTIEARDNVPVLSFLLLRGRCRTCGEPISAAYPLLEAATAGLFVVAGLAIDSVWVAAMVAPFLGVLLAAAVIDARHFIIPNQLVLTSSIVFGAAIVLLRIAGQDVSVVRALLGALTYGGGLLLLHLAYPRGMGFGDVKFAGLLGLVLGSLGWAYVAVAAFAAVFSAGVVGVAVLVGGGTRKSKLPFGVFMAFGALVAVVFAPAIASWYLGLAR